MDNNFSKPGISYVMPAYNCEKTLAEAVDSIFEGNFEDGDEVIIVNDASADGTKEVAESLAAKYGPAIRLINSDQNKGCPASRNIGIAASKNELIFNLDADDILAPDSVGLLKSALISNGADMAAFGESHYFIDDKDKLTHKRIYKPGFLSLADFLSGPYGPTGNCLYTKKSWERIGGYWEYGKGLHEYWGFFLKQLANGSRLFVVKDSYYYHRHGGKSLFTGEFKNEEASSLMASKMIAPFLHLLSDEDAAYIKSDIGSRKWLARLGKSPIRLKNCEVGQDGREVMIEGLAAKIKRKILKLIKD